MEHLWKYEGPLNWRSLEIMLAYLREHRTITIELPALPTGVIDGRDPHASDLIEGLMQKANG